MSEPMTIVLDDEQHRRWLAIAGRRSAAPEALARDLIVRAIESDKPGKVNPVLRALDLTPTGRPQRFCDQCGDPLPQGSTKRRRFCAARCRVAASREA